MDYAIILGGGRGLRMGTAVPKQFLEVGGTPILMLTIRRFLQYAETCRRPLGIVLVLPREQQDFWRELCRKHLFDANCLIANGGETRFHSIKNGLALIPKEETDGVVAVHDGVRPFPSVEVIGRVMETARKTGAAIPVTPVIETLRQLQPAAASPSLQHSAPAPLEATPSATVPRSHYCLVQTPQAFTLELHRRAYAQPYSEAFTDDASVVEALGHPIALVEGNRENIKITTPFDLKVAECLQTISF